jgi:hypothetical protein
MSSPSSSPWRASGAHPCRSHRLEEAASGSASALAGPDELIQARYGTVSDQAEVTPDSKPL